MPKGPNGQKRPADAVGMSVMVAKIATGEVEDTKYASQNRRKSGVAGANARMQTLTPERRSEIATQASQARWKKGNDDMSQSQAVVDCSELDSIYAAKRTEGLVDVKFLHKNLDEGTPAQVEADLVEIQNAIRDGKVEPLNFGDLRLKEA